MSFLEYCKNNQPTNYDKKNWVFKIQDFNLECNTLGPKMPKSRQRKIKSIMKLITLFFRFFRLMPCLNDLNKRNLVELIYAEKPINSCMNVLIFFYCTLLKMFLTASASKVLQVTQFIVVVVVVVVAFVLFIEQDYKTNKTEQD